ncbi:MAG: nucleotidyltransferase domain-containing protein [Desulfurococcaceae archaeon]
MSRVKVRYKPEFREVVYSEEHWKLLEELRSTAIRVVEALSTKGIEAWLHGSLARGDVWAKSDIDIVIPRRVNGYAVELALEGADFKPYAKYLVAATPTTTLKAYIALDQEERVTVSFPLADYKPHELEFYKFGGFLTMHELLSGKRVPGVNKGLVLILPTPGGHLEAPVVGYEDYTARVLGIDVSVVKERVKVLTRRDEAGRTGIFGKLALLPGESFEEGVKRLLKEKPLLRRAYSDLA